MSFHESFLLDDSIVEESQQQCASQSIIKKRFRTANYATSTPLEHTNIPLGQNDEIKCILNGISKTQKELAVRMNAVEANQTAILEKLNFLIEGQVSISTNQRVIKEHLEQQDCNSVQKPEMLAQSALLRECKVVVHNIERSVSLMTGEARNSALDDVASLLPLESLESIMEVEERLVSPEFKQAMTTYLYRLKGTSDDVENVVKNIFTDSLLESFNWDGRGEKQALGNLALVESVLRAVFQQQGAFEFEKGIRRAVAKSHHRIKQKNYMEKRTQN